MPKQLWLFKSVLRLRKSVCLGMSSATDMWHECWLLLPKRVVHELCWLSNHRDRSRNWRYCRHRCCLRRRLRADFLHLFHPSASPRTHRPLLSSLCETRLCLRGRRDESGPNRARTCGKRCRSARRGGRRRGPCGCRSSADSGSIRLWFRLRFVFVCK